MKLKLKSPAKLNLFFRVLEKRADGFHEIASLMQAISFYDILYFECGETDRLTCSDPKIPLGKGNFIHQACILFREKTGYDIPLSIHLEKKVPTQGGLGGGSGNVATTLWALKELSGLPITEEILQSWAGEISSDAPFFFSSGTAYSTGRGEKIETLSPLPRQTLYIAKPKGGLSTPLVYKHCTPNIYLDDPKDLLEKALSGRFIPLNDLEAAAFFLYPKLHQLKKDLLNLGFETALMTGSGTSFFCFGPVKNPILPAIQFTKVDFISRSEGSWY